MAKKSNWDILKNKDVKDTNKYRDVFGDQQLERSKIEKTQTFKTWQIFMLVAALIVGLISYMVASAITMFVYRTSEKESPVPVVEGYSPNVQYGWVVSGINAQGNDVYTQMQPGEDPSMYADLNGRPEYSTKDEVPKPEWYLNAEAEYNKLYAEKKDEIDAWIQEDKMKSSFGYNAKPHATNLGAFLLMAMLVYGAMYPKMRRSYEAQTILERTDDINQYANDRHVALPEEILQHPEFDIFPDVGATSNVQLSSMISHFMLSKKGLKNVEFSKRAKEDTKDEDGDILYYKGEVLTDDDGKILTETLPIIDEKFGEDLFKASNQPKEVRKYWDVSKIPYNEGDKYRDRQGGNIKTIGELINKDWELPYYEPQRPAGFYLVDTAPVNTMVLAITRAGKGQTYIEPVIDMWLRERRPNNMVINDPKGELLVKFYVPATFRGFQVVQFNLINVLKTDIYNPLLLAAAAARENDFTKSAMYIENIADVFFPVDGADDPVWPNAANNAFKRAAYGLIDYYLEEEKELRLHAMQTNMPAKVLETKVDQLWSKVTLYNCYQLFVQLTSKKLKNPTIEFNQKFKAGEFNGMSDEEYDKLLNEVELKSKLWEDKPEADLLTLFFNATNNLPKNQMRTLVGNADNALRSIGGAEKMLSSVYGIAITAMSFFTDPTISSLTSGAPSQNVDLAGLSFPRRIGVRFSNKYIERYKLKGLQARWQIYEDENFEKSLGSDFYHEDMINLTGWAKCYFKGILPNEVSYFKLEIVNPSTNMIVKRFYFKFTKTYQTSLDGRTYMKDPVLDVKIVKDGILEELIKVEKTVDGKKVSKYVSGGISYTDTRIRDIETNGHKEEYERRAVVQTMTRYSEKPKATFLVTPPHLMKYAKLILILVKQLVDLNFDQSYMTNYNNNNII